MKVAYLVSTPDDVPPRVRQRMVVMNEKNYQEIYASYLGLDKSMIMFVQAEVKLERLLKFVEEYAGNLAVYFTGIVSPVLLSRFNHFENRRVYERVSFPKLSSNEELVDSIKNFILT